MRCFPLFLLLAERAMRMCHVRSSIRAYEKRRKKGIHGRPGKLLDCTSALSRLEKKDIITGQLPYHS
jgi:hypothetical protein